MITERPVTLSFEKPIPKDKYPMFLEEIRRVAPFCHADESDLVDLKSVPFCHADSTGHGRLYVLRVGAWLIALNYHPSSKEDDAYVEGKLIEVDF